MGVYARYGLLVYWLLTSYAYGEETFVCSDSVTQMTLRCEVAWGGETEDFSSEPDPSSSEGSAPGNDLPNRGGPQTGDSTSTGAGQTGNSTSKGYAIGTINDSNSGSIRLPSFGQDWLRSNMAIVGSSPSAQVWNEVKNTATGLPLSVTLPEPGTYSIVLELAVGQRATMEGWTAVKVIDESGSENLMELQGCYNPEGKYNFCRFPLTLHRTTKTPTKITIRVLYQTYGTILEAIAYAGSALTYQRLGGL